MSAKNLKLQQKILIYITTKYFQYTKTHLTFKKKEVQKQIPEQSKPILTPGLKAEKKNRVLKSVHNLDVTF